MITAGFKNLMKQVLSSGGTSQGLLPIKDVGGTTRYLADYTAYPYTVSTTFTLTASDAGISVGTGNTASSENDYQLASTITSGLTGSVLVSKSVDSNDNSSIVLFVTLTNTTGSDISIFEIGYKQECSASDAQDGTTTTDRVFLVDRTVLATPITIPANGQGIIRYTLTTKYGSAGGVEDVLVNGTSVVTAGIARVTVPTVEANPSGTPTADLTKLQIGNGIYGVTNVSANVAVSTLAAPLTTLKINDDEYTVPSGGGGTTVVANPSGTATDDLEKIQIGNTIYDIPSGGGGEQLYLSDYYSTEERVVGRWTDGKPLYQKTLVYTNTTINAWVNHDLSALHIETLLVKDGWANRITPQNVVLIHPMHYYEAASGNYDVNCRFDTDGQTLDIYVKSPSGNNTNKQVVTIQYTKTTDAPGTGPTAGNIIYLPALYSEEEREVGVDEDGYPVYQKTIPIGALNRGTSWNSVAHGISNFKMLKKLFGTMRGSGDNRNYSIPIYRSGENQGIIVGADATNIYYINNWISDAVDARVTVQYTKTTDTPGSGTWTPDGQYAHHYSTSEHIVGTWIDGSTLYEITFTTPALTSNAWNENNLPVANINKIVGYEILMDELQDSIPYTFSLGSADGGRYEAQFWHNRNADKYQMYVKAQETVSDIYATITIRYTKTV